ncbi:MAG TPA: zf-TFIIB domain-containing protein [Candidatus Saccharimonadales bacterium]|jgi:Zn-finger nucleic acid-binding protein|nr:zf-TFIIB domain-containing protein [Candidatus Saccharimonadales bacterium]
MPAEILKCPSCGASVSTGATHCEYCKARLATVACPACFGMMFVGEKFCSHCGARAERTEVQSGEQRLCPRCQSDMKPITIGANRLLECEKCEGLWADAASLEQITTEREQQAAVLGMPGAHAETAELEKHIRYLPCPVCQKLMNRVNFARCSYVIVDVCKAHGTWFDKDELRRAVEFIRAGGMEKARTRQLEEIEEQQRNLRGLQSVAGPFTDDDHHDTRTIGSAIDIADFLVSLWRR